MDSFLTMSLIIASYGQILYLIHLSIMWIPFFLSDKAFLKGLCVLHSLSSFMLEMWIALSGFNILLVIIFFSSKFCGNFFLTFIVERQRQTDSMSMGGTERGGDMESETGSRIWAVSTEPHMGLKLTNHEIMTRAKVRCLTDWATQVPL